MDTKELPNFKAAIFDMDGVITQTASLHAIAWKQMFDEFLEHYIGSDYHELDIDTDYKKYIDGIPRFDGVRSFLQSRNIIIPEGSPDDKSGTHTIFGLGLRKNEIFLTLLRNKGVHVFEDALEIIMHWRKKGIKLAAISSSRNCRFILDSAGLTDSFDAIVDGEDSLKENIVGKPHPAIFLRACELLNADVKETIVIEDAISGIEAGKRGNFALVIGVARNEEVKMLEDAGADIVVADLSSLDITEKSKPADLKNILAHPSELYKNLNGKEPALFLDYDGTLSPIVSDPDFATLPEKNRKILEELSQMIKVAAISAGIEKI
jgi:trehalose 6-phosphate phosphatase